MRLLLIIFFICYSNISVAELLKPNPALLPEEVILIQLKALQNNDNPYRNAGIEQTWEFAHPSNRQFTGPLDNFVSMIHSSYSMMLNHLEHKVILLKNNKEQSFFFIEIVDETGVRLRFNWIVEKVNADSLYKDCWMTTTVSLPVPLSNSA